MSVPELDISGKSRTALGGKSIGRSARQLKRGSPSGKAGLIWVVLLALAALGTLAWWRSSGDERNPGEPTLPGVAAPAAGPAGAANTGSSPASTEIPMYIQPALEVGRSEGLATPKVGAFDESRLVGRGNIRGFVQAPPGIEFPLEWTLTAEPSNSLIGHERAETRLLEFHNGEQEFELQDLALGGYMLRASAFGLASDQQHMLLAKPAETELYVVMQFSVTAFVEGSVRYDDSTPAVGLELALEPRPSGARVVAVSDSIGHFLFTDVKSGGYTLHFGNPENPVRPPIEINVGKAPEHLADSIVPKMCDLIVRVLRAGAFPVEGVKVDGYGDHGGRFAGETNRDGEYRARYLPAGRITVNAQFPDGERVSGRKQVEVGVLDLIELVRER